MSSPMIVTLGQQYNVGERPTVILNTYINRHARPSDTTKTKYNAVVHSCYPCSSDPKNKDTLRSKLCISFRINIYLLFETRQIYKFLPINSLLLLLFLTFSVLVANPKKLLYTVANPARGLLNREKRTKEKVWQHTPPPPPPTLLVRRK